MQAEFELVNYDVSVQGISDYASGTSPRYKWN